MAGREVDVKTGDYYWRQDEIIRRFKGLQKDFKAGLAVESMERQAEMMDGKITEEQYLAYIDGFEAACEMMAENLELRFNEITKVMQ